jgi:DNA replication protein DnaD
MLVVNFIGIRAALQHAHSRIKVEWSYKKGILVLKV